MAEMNKELIERLALEVCKAVYVYFETGLPDGDYKLFPAPQPAIPEGMALIPPAKEFPPLYPDESADEQLKLAHYISGWNGCRDSMIAAAGVAP